MKMKREDVVARLRELTADGVAPGMVGLLEAPPGRKPQPALAAASRWYRALPAEAREHVRWIAEEAAQTSLFGVLAVLDGVRKLDDDPHLKLELRLVDQSESLLLNEERGEYLHDLL